MRCWQLNLFFANVFTAGAGRGVTESRPGRPAAGELSKSYGGDSNVRSAARGILRAQRILLFVCCLCVGGCGRRQNDSSPSVEFNKIPPAEKGGGTRLDTVSGSVFGARPGQQIVLFARSGAWYVQPLTDRQFTEIRPDSTWENSTHLGTEYAALLVEPGYQPPSVTDEVPRPGGGVIAVAVVPGEPAFWQKRWFKLTAGVICLAMLFALYRLRLRHLTRQLNVRFEERLAERMRVAQDLHDTLLQSLVSVSMQLDVATDKMPAESSARASLDPVRRMMTQAIEEGHKTVSGLCSDSGISLDIADALSRVGKDLAAGEAVKFGVAVTGRVRPLHPLIGDEVYRIGREALTNALRHSGAQNVAVKLEYAHNRLRIYIRDDGPRSGRSEKLTTENDDSLAAMRGRVEKIGSRLRVRRPRAGGGEVELIVPGHIAFQK